MTDFPKCPADLKKDTRYCAYCPYDDQCATQIVLDCTVCKITRNCYDDAINEISLLKTSCPAPVLVPSSDKSGAPYNPRHMLLSETVTGGLSITGNFILSDLDDLLK